MYILHGFLKKIGALLLIVIVILILYIFVKTVKILIKNKGKGSIKRKWKHKLYHIRKTRYIKPIEFAKWIIVDLLRGKDYLRLYGIWAFCGYYGEGKTMGCVQFARNLVLKHPNRNITLASNIKVTYRDPQGRYKKAIQLHSWEEILKLPKNSIVIYDESQSDWSCNIGVNSFPEDFLRRITICRKRGLALFMTSPVFNRMNINLRESVNFVVVCKNIFQLDRWFTYTFYHSEDYETYRENKLKLKMHRYLKYSFVVQDKDYNAYDTVEEVESIKEQDTKVKKGDVILLSDMFKKFRNEIYKEMDIKLKDIKA